MTKPRPMAMLTSAPNLVCICVDEVKDEQKSGCFHHKYSAEPVPYSDLNHMLILMDKLMDWLNFPQTSTKLRSFKDDPKVIPERIRGGQQVRSADDILNETGKKATFVVNVQYRQNATWQGKVLWAETGKTCNFRSALELLKLIDCALELEDAASQEEQTDSGRENNE